MFSIASASLPAGETPVCGVTLEPFVRCRWGEQKGAANLSQIDEFPLESAALPGSHSLRYRWLRSPFTNGEGQTCHIHSDRQATLQCTIWAKLNFPVAYSYHCGVDCFRLHWHLQKQYYEKALLSSQGACEARGFAAPRAAPLASRGARAGTGAESNGYKSSAPALKSGDAAWTVVGKTKDYLPTELDVGHRLKLVIQAREALGKGEGPGRAGPRCGECEGVDGRDGELAERACAWRGVRAHASRIACSSHLFRTSTSQTL